MNVFSHLAPAIRRNLRILFTVGLLFWASLTALLPTLSLYVQHVGGNNQQVGVVIGAFAIGMLLFRPWMGRLADQQGRKLVLLIGMVVVAIAPLGYLFTQSIPLLIAIRAFHGLSIAAFTTAYSALVVDISPVQNRGEVIGYMSLVNPIGMAIGPALGGFLLEWAGYAPLFLLSAGAGFIGLVCAFQVEPPPLATIQAISGQKLDQPFWQLIGSPRLRIPTVVLLLIGVAFGALATFLPLLIQATRINFNAGLFFAAGAASSFGVRLLTGRASDRYGRGQFITLSLGLYTAAMVLIWSAQHPISFLLAGVIEGAGAGILIPMMLALIADRAHPEERGRVFGLCWVGFDLGIAIAGPILGYFADTIGYRGLFALASGLSFLALMIFMTQGSKDLSHSVKFALGKAKDLYALPRSVAGTAQADRD